MKFIIKLLVLTLFLISSIKPAMSFQGESVPQALGPTSIAITENGQYAYIGFHGSENVIKVRLEDFTVEKVADLTEYFPIQSYFIALDSSEEKLFVHNHAWRKLLVLDTHSMKLVQTIDNIEAGGIIRSQYGPFLIAWEGNTVKFVNTETYEVTEFVDPDISFLGIRESKHNVSHWYAITQNNFGWILGTYDYEAMVWNTLITFPLQEYYEGIPDFKVLEDEQKAYVGSFCGFYPEGNHSYGWFYSIDLMNQDIKAIPIDGGVLSLEMSPDNRWVYIATDHPLPDDTNNILVFDTQSDTIVSQIHLGRREGIWPYTEIRDLQLDPVHPNLLYAVCADADAFVKVDLNSRILADALCFWKIILMPHFFVKRQNQPTGYILIHKSANAFELDLDKATITNVVEFPLIRDDVYNYDIAINDAGRMFIAQGETILEVDMEDMQIIETHPLPQEISLWSFVLSNDKTKLYSIREDPYEEGYVNEFLAINTTDFQVEARVRLEGGIFNWRPYELPDSSKLYVLGGQHNGSIVIHVIETENYTILKSITFEEPGLLGISAGPYYPFAYDSSSHTLFVGATHVVLALDTDTDMIKKVIYLGDVARAIGLEPMRFIYGTAMGLVYHPQENYLYIAQFDRHFVSIYDLSRDQFLSHVIPLKGFSTSYAFANDDYSKIYCLNTNSDNVSVIDVESKMEEKVIDLHAYLPDTLTSVQAKEEILREFSLSQNYPNPFNPSTMISYQIPKTIHVSIEIYNILGQKVVSLVDKKQNAGRYQIQWESKNQKGEDVASGLYILRFSTSDFVQSNKLLLLR